MGEVAVLNVGAGDIKVTFNHLDEAEAQKAIRMLNDMQQRGYAILVETAEGEYARATSIDASRGRYIVSLPDTAPLPAGAEEEPHKKRRPGRPRKVSIPIQNTRSVGVARSAGG